MKTHYYTDEIVSICENQHLTVDQIFKELKTQFSEVGRSSIYRNVEELCKKWELKKVKWIGNKSYFEKSKQEHIHLIDSNSWKIFDLDISHLKISNLPKGFKIKSMDMKVYGEFA